ncbi:MAG TPA: AzlC family ABC transporter permease [Firmicutes bacterium]|nr:AzlC family ABC transporter permease [Bacillota bacterium]
MWSSTRTQSPRLQLFLLGVQSAIPIMAGYIPVGFAYGVLARQSGLSLLQSTAMSIVVYAGSSQFIAVSMLAGGGAVGAVISTTLLVNLRHLLFSASLAPYFRRFPSPVLAFLSFGITDETYAVGIGQYPDREPRGAQVLGLHLASYLSWIIGSCIGAAAGGIVGDGARWGLDFALPGMFIALLIGQIKDGITLIVAMLSGLISITLARFHSATWGVIPATIISAAVGVVFKQWIQRHSP